MGKIKNLLNRKNFRYFSYFMLITVMIFLLWSIGQFFNLNQFLESIELKTLDFRFGVKNRVIKPDPNIVIVNIDDNSLELLQNEFGNWPWNRNAYIKLINYLESKKVDSIAFDLMFIGHQTGNEKFDKELAQTVAKNKNIYVSMNFDNSDQRKPPILPDSLKVNLENLSPVIDFSTYTFLNCKLIMNEILNLSSNIGLTNCPRDRDNITRHAPLFIKYKNDFYPYLAFKVAYNYLAKHENIDKNKFIINKENQLILGDKKIPLAKNGSIILNWYGAERTFPQIPFWTIIQSANAVKSGKKPVIPPEYFKNKVVFVGVTANSLFDIKCTPLSSIYPGVEVQATAFNNIIDNSPVKKADNMINLAICAVLSLITGMLVIRIKSVIFSSLSVIITSVLYIILASILFTKYFIWIWIFNPILFITLTFIFMYIIKYLMKSRDFEYTYKLATTDGLTGLYNNRYFKEALENAIKEAQKHNLHFSLIFIDIDFFKKFNDTYGHQAGDVVLRQVAQIIKRTVKSTDFVARYGGEEMCAILYDMDIKEVINIANRLCSAVASRKFKLAEGVEVNVTISLGVSTYPQYGKTPEELIEFADQELYRAKKDGRNRVGNIEDTSFPNSI